MKIKLFRSIKPEIRVLGVDDGFFVPHSKGTALVVGIVFRGGLWLDGVIHTRVEVDGFDAVDKIAAMVTNSPHHKQLRVIMLGGVTFAGFNIVDIKQLSDKTELPVIAVTRDKPDLKGIHKALTNLTFPRKRWKAIQDAGEIFPVFAHNEREKVYACVSGISKENAVEVLQVTATRSSIPEPLRVAHLVASGTTP